MIDEFYVGDYADQYKGHTGHVIMQDMIIQVSMQVILQIIMQVIVWIII